MVYELKVTLKNIDVPVWRKILVYEETTFEELHDILQVTFQWEWAHLHTFMVERSDGVKVERTEITEAESIDNFESPSLFKVEQYDESEELLDDWLIEINDKITYIYDFGDDWHHEIVLTKKIDDEDHDYYPVCIGAKNLAPGEDSRFEVISGTAKLTYRNSQEIIDEINDEFEELLEDFLLEDMIDFWPETLELAKEFHRSKPWEIMGDGDIFGVLDPISGEMMYCSILGSADEMYGLAVYEGYEGYYMLLNIVNGIAPTQFDIQQYQNSLLLSFEDREDLEKEEYDLVKAYDVSFRGRKSWPSFRSFKPGYYPWFMDNRDAQKMLFALHEALFVVEEMKKGLYLPDIVNDEELFIRIPSETKEMFEFESKIIGIEHLQKLNPVYKNEISEFDLKRASKIKKVLPMKLEFIFANINFPMTDDEHEFSEGDRPILPTMMLAIDVDEEMMIDHHLAARAPSVYDAQMVFLSLLKKLNGKPSSVVTDLKTALLISALLDDLGIKMEISADFPLTRTFINDLEEKMTNHDFSDLE